MHFVTYNGYGEECQRFFLDLSVLFAPFFPNDIDYTSSYHFGSDSMVIQHPEGSFMWIIPRKKRASITISSQTTIPLLGILVLNESHIWQLGGYDAYMSRSEIWAPDLNMSALFSTQMLDLKYSKVSI